MEQSIKEETREQEKLLSPKVGTATSAPTVERLPLTDKAFPTKGYMKKEAYADSANLPKHGED